MSNRFDHTIYELQELDTLSTRDQWMNHLHPLVKLLLTLAYIALTVSFSRYDLSGLIAMMVYPIAVFSLAELSLTRAFKRIRLVLPFVLVLGILNPFFDRAPMLLGGFLVRRGVVSMLTLMFKCIFTVLAGYILIATTSLEDICRALEQLHVPQILILQIMLMYRYIFLLIGEAGRISQAYELRAPGQKGIHISAWGSLVGQLLFRTIDRGTIVYESMLLRGFKGTYTYAGANTHPKRNDLYYLLFWLILLSLLRFFPVIRIFGSIAG